MSRFLVNGGLDVSSAAILAALSIVMGLQIDQPWALALDVAAFTAAACVPWWPKVGGAALAVLLIGYFFLPLQSVVGLGEYAPLIPILCSGLRGQRGFRIWMTAVYWTILTALQYHADPGTYSFVIAGLAWAALMAVLWLVGNAYSLSLKVQAESYAAALTQQRISVARDLHDTVARDLSRAVLRAQLARQNLDADELGVVVSEIQSALAQLRWTLALLRDPQTDSQAPTEPSSPRESLRDAARALESAGFTASWAVEGDTSRIPQSTWPILRAVVGEAAANIERHADKTRACALILSVNRRDADLVFINEVTAEHAELDSSGQLPMGLLGVRERLAAIGGELRTLQEGQQWMTYAKVPLADDLSPGS